MRFKGQDGGRQTRLTRGIDQAHQQGGMTPMNSVKITNCHSAGAGNRTRKAAKNAHLMLEKRGDYSG
jgi:hypothetical protein